MSEQTSPDVPRRRSSGTAAATVTQTAPTEALIVTVSVTAIHSELSAAPAAAASLSATPSASSAISSQASATSTMTTTQNSTSTDDAIISANECLSFYAPILAAATATVTATQSTSGNFIQPAPVYTKKEQERRHVLSEILSSEKKYLSDLKEIVEGYYTEMLKAASGGATTINSATVAHIFSNIGEIYEFTKSFFLMLEDSTNDEIGIANCFIKTHTTFIRLYSAYCQNYKTAYHTTERLESDAAIARIIQRVRVKYGHYLKMATYLQLPVLRITKYHLLLQRYLKLLEQDSFAYAQVLEALELMRQVNDQINQDMPAISNDGNRRRASTSVTMSTSSSSSSSSSSSTQSQFCHSTTNMPLLVSAFGPIIKQGNLALAETKKVHYVIVFERAMLVRKAASSSLVMHWIRGEDLSFLPRVTTSSSPNKNKQLIIVDCSRNKSDLMSQFTLKAKSTEEKQAWQAAMLSCILGSAGANSNKNKNDHKAYAANTAVPFGCVSGNIGHYDANNPAAAAATNNEPLKKKLTSFKRLTDFRYTLKNETGGSNIASVKHSNKLDELRNESKAESMRRLSVPLHKTATLDEDLMFSSSSSSSSSSTSSSYSSSSSTSSSSTYGSDGSTRFIRIIDRTLGLSSGSTSSSSSSSSAASSSTAATTGAASVIKRSTGGKATHRLSVSSEALNNTTGRLFSKFRKYDAGAATAAAPASKVVVVPQLPPPIEVKRSGQSRMFSGGGGGCGGGGSGVAMHHLKVVHEDDDYQRPLNQSYEEIRASSQSRSNSPVPPPPPEFAEAPSTKILPHSDTTRQRRRASSTAASQHSQLDVSLLDWTTPMSMPMPMPIPMSMPMPTALLHVVDETSSTTSASSSVSGLSLNSEEGYFSSSHESTAAIVLNLGESLSQRRRRRLMLAKREEAAAAAAVAADVDDHLHLCRMPRQLDMTPLFRTSEDQFVFRHDHGHLSNKKNDLNDNDNDDDDFLRVMASSDDLANLTTPISSQRSMKHIGDVLTCAARRGSASLLLLPSRTKASLHTTLERTAYNAVDGGGCRDRGCPHDHARASACEQAQQKQHARITERRSTLSKLRNMPSKFHDFLLRSVDGGSGSAINSCGGQASASSSNKAVSSTTPTIVLGGAGVCADSNSSRTNATTTPHRRRKLFHSDLRLNMSSVK